MLRFPQLDLNYQTHRLLQGHIPLSLGTSPSFRPSEGGKAMRLRECSFFRRFAGITALEPGPNFRLFCVVRPTAPYPKDLGAVPG